MGYKEMLEVIKGLSQSELDLLEHAERPNAVYFSKRVNEAVDPYGEILSHSDMVDSLYSDCRFHILSAGAWHSVQGKWRAETGQQYPAHDI